MISGTVSARSNHETRSRLGKIFGALIERVRFAMDSPLEGTRLEPSVPLLRQALWALPIGDGGTKGGSTYIFRSETAMLAWSGSPWPFPRGGTVSSNPSSSSGESVANSSGSG